MQKVNVLDIIFGSIIKKEQNKHFQILNKSLDSKKVKV